MKELLTSRDVASLLRVSPSTLSRWRDSGTGPSWSDLNGIPRYRADDVTEFVQRCSHDRF